MFHHKDPFDRLLAATALVDQEIVGESSAAVMPPRQHGLGGADAEVVPGSSTPIRRLGATSQPWIEIDDAREERNRWEAREAIEVLGEPGELGVGREGLEDHRGSASRHADEEDRPFDRRRRAAAGQLHR